MKISVVIPAYNAATTLPATLESVFRQSLAPHEIIVLDDASTDDTPALLEGYAPRVRVEKGRHKGVAEARNQLCRAAKGDLVAFLDADDLWHPDYLGTQVQLFKDHPQAVALFTGHVVLQGDSNHTWEASPAQDGSRPEVIDSLDFLTRYNRHPGVFNMSFCCVPKRVLEGLGSEPFKISVAEDWYFFNCLALAGSVAYLQRPLVAYRVRPGSLSSNRLRLSKAILTACETVQPKFEAHPDPRFASVFREAFAEKRRIYAKQLLYHGKKGEAREQLSLALAQCRDMGSKAKAMVILGSTYLPSYLQPDWLRKHPQWKGSSSS